MSGAGGEATVPVNAPSGKPGKVLAFGRRGWLITGVLLVVAAVADLTLGRDLPGFDAVYGFAGCVAIIVVSKWLGKRWLQRTEDYYEEGGHA